ncbi:VOC family protein [Thalassotalea eurytherma]|uniref:Glyoxalase n=1 Tax=Thalassotalea eurytherma TaxID=1144278 RepID=A0ABQ6H1Y0_9GAMM|nr:VOC family protein [Thalassotalea eurytherma]GLX81110.1 glyoxalase [Thalassotalea eurytherma]
MMTLEHINLVVKDMEETLTFYKAAFPHWWVRGNGFDKWHGLPRQWLHFGDDYQYLAFSDNGQGENRDLNTLNLGLAHFAFSVTDIDALAKRLQASGYNADKAGAENPYRRNLYYIDPNGFEVEFVEYLSDLPNERNHYND